MPIPAIKGSRGASQCLETIGVTFRSHHGGTIKCYMSEAYKLINASVRHTHGT